MTESFLDSESDAVDLSLGHKGSLLVSIVGLGSFSPDFKDGATLFDYIGHTAAVLGTNLTTKLSIETRSEDWRVLHYDSKERFLDVVQVEGEIITEPEDDIPLALFLFGDFGDVK